MIEKSSSENFLDMSDEQLVQASLNNKDNFYYLMKRYEPKIIRYIDSLTNINPEESKDVLQEIFIKVYRNLLGYNQNLSFSSWIYRIAHNEIINQYHKNKFRSKISSLNDDDKTLKLAEIILDNLDIHETYISKENSEKLRETLSRLPTKYREVLVLHYLEDISYKEISDILRKPLGTIATLINRAKSKLKKIAKHNSLIA